MEQTAIGIAIEEIGKLFLEIDNRNKAGDRRNLDGGRIFAYGECQAVLIRLRDTVERDQLIEANREGVDMVVDAKSYLTGEQWYTSKFGTDETEM